MKKQILPGLFALLFCAAGITACSARSKVQVLPAQDVEAIGTACEDLARLQVETWDMRDPEKLRDIYTKDIVHFDGNPAYIGIESVLGMATRMFRNFPAWNMEAGDTYVSKEKCLGTWVNWGIFGATEDDPALEFDLLETVGDKISFWRLFYDENFGFFPVDYELLNQFGQSWSQDDENALLALYSQDAEVQDTLFGVTTESQREIAGYAEGILALSQGGSWDLILPFAEGTASINYQEEYPFPSTAGVFSINTRKADGTACEVRVAVILTPDEDGKIQAQQTFYDAKTLIECGWAK